jgi:hypothetical protein
MSELDKVNEFLNKRRAIEQDQRLSQDGRIEANKVLDAEIGAYKPAAINNLRASIELAKSKFKNAEHAIAKAIDDQANSWDFQRLNYNAQAVGLQFENTPSAEDAAMLYDELQGSHDRYKIRAAAEVGAGVIMRRFGQERGGDLTRRMRGDLEAMSSAPEIDATKKAAGAAGREVIRAAEEIKKVSDFYYPGRGFSGINEFSNLLEGVKISQRINPAADPDKVSITTIAVD